MWATRLQIELNSKCQLETWLDNQSNLQQWAEQELKQTQARDRDRSWDRNRNRDRDKDRDKELDREDEESEESEASTESLFEYQQKVSNDKDFYKMFKIWYECDM